MDKQTGDWIETGSDYTSYSISSNYFVQWVLGMKKSLIIGAIVEMQLIVHVALANVIVPPNA